LAVPASHQIPVDTITSKSLGKQPLSGRFRTSLEGVLVTPTGIEPVFQP
jgi:hypothetical protein